MMADSDLQRTHPATVIVRSAKALWQMLLGLLAVFVFGNIGEDSTATLIISATIAIAVTAAVGFSWLNWWRFQYGIVGTDLLVVEGLFVRKRRTIPLARVHGVNVNADLFMRLMGLVEVVVQTAGGGANEPEAKIGAIPLARAEELRSVLLYDTSDAELVTGVIVSGDPEDAALSPQNGTSAEQLIGADPVGRISDFRGAFGGSEHTGRELLFEHKVPLGRLIIGEITSNRVPIILAILFGVSGQMVEVVGEEIIEDTASQALSLAVPVLIGVILVVGALAILIATATAVARDFGFTARRYETRIETEAGLIERRQISIPVTRIQAVRIEESWLRKLLGLATIHVQTAGLEQGGGQGQPASGSKAMVPVAKLGDVPSLMHSLLPEAEIFPRTHPLPKRALRFYIFAPTVLWMMLVFVLVTPTSWFLYRPALPWSFGGVLLIGLIVGTVRSLQWRAAGIGTNDDAVTFNPVFSAESVSC